MSTEKPAQNHEDLTGFAAIPRWIQRDPDVPPGAKLIYITINSRLGVNGAAFPSHETMAHDSGMSVASVKRALSQLNDLGVLSWRRTGGSNVYTLATSRPEGWVKPIAHTELSDPEPVSGSLTVSEPIAHTELSDSSQGATKDSNQGFNSTIQVVAPAKPKKPVKRATRIPEDFTITEEMFHWAVDRGITVDLPLATEMFVNHWKSASGRTSTKLDWPATWRNWILSDQANGKFQIQGGGTLKRHPNTQQAMDITARLRAREAEQDASERHQRNTPMALRR